jgi:hypothetical protein
MVIQIGNIVEYTYLHTSNGKTLLAQGEVIGKMKGDLSLVMFPKKYTDLRTWQLYEVPKELNSGFKTCKHYIGKNVRWCLNSQLKTLI